MTIDPKLQNLIDHMIVECERLTMDDIETYDVQGVSPLTDRILIATATHILQLEAARRSLTFMAKEAGYPILNPTEDYSEGWLVMDFADLIVHILIAEKRAFYDLDGLMESVRNSRNQSQEEDYDEEELTEQQLEDILEQLNEEEKTEFLEDLENNINDKKNTPL